MKRGEIWVAPVPPPQGHIAKVPEDIPRGKPRPVIVLQDDQDLVIILQDEVLVGEELKTATVCPLTTEPPDSDNPDNVHGSPMRIFVERNAENQLKVNSWAKADWVTTVERKTMHGPKGQLGDEALQNLERAIATFLLGFGSKELGSVVQSWHRPQSQ